MTDPSLSAAAHDGCALGIDIGGTKVELALVDGGGRVHDRVRIPTQPARGAEAVLADAVRTARAHFGPALAGARACGIAVAGQVTEDGVLRGAPNLGWSDVRLAALVAGPLAIPVVALNDVRAATLAEWRVGGGAGAGDVVVLFIGTGLGGGIVIDGRLVGGADGTAGELGHGTLVANGRPCHCRNRGCLEAYVSGWALADRAREAVAALPTGAVEAAALVTAAGDAAHIRGAHVTTAAAAGDPLAARLVRETVDWLAAGVVGIVNALDPARVLFGGSVADALPDLVEHLTAEVRARALPPAADRVRLARASLGDDAPVIGAALAALHHA